MSRVLVACLLVVTCVPVLAAPPAPAVRYVAKVKFLHVRGGEVTELQTEVAGTPGKPAKIELGGAAGRKLRVEIEDVRTSRPTQYLSRFTLTETGPGGKEDVLSAPTIITTADRPATLQVGEEPGDRTRVELTVREIGVARK